MPTHGLTEARVERIAGLMRSLRFRRGVTVRRLAKEWGLSEQYVRELSAEASKKVCAEVTDKAAVSVKVGATLERVIDRMNRDLEKGATVKGVNSKGEPCVYEVDPTKLAKVAIDAGKTWGMLAQLMTTRVEVTGTVDGVQLPTDPAERAAVYEALAERERGRVK